jgi:DNA-binding transcriptional ArsR family regulator
VVLATYSRMIPTDTIFAALADPTRRGVVDLLRTRPYRAGDLAEALALEPAALSRHLRLLKRAGLVADEHPQNDARVRLYSLRREAFADLRGWLDEVEAFWTGQLSGFADYLDAEKGKA